MRNMENEKYLLVYEDGALQVLDEIGKAETESVEAGILDVVRQSDMKQLGDDGEWHEIKMGGRI